MATYYAPNGIPAYLGTDTDMRNWFITIHAALTAVGMVQTSDTGQVNTSTVTLPGTSNTVAGYSIWRFSDSLQGTLPVYIKLEGGTGISVANRPSQWITVGTGSNGSGTLTGQLSARTQRSTTSTRSAGNTNSVFASGTTSRIHLWVYDFSTTGNSLGFFIERTKTSSGTETADGIIAGIDITHWQIIPATGTIPTASSNGFCVPVDQGGQSQVLTDIAVGTQIAYCSGKPVYGYMAVVSQTTGQSLNTFQASALGLTHTWLATTWNGSAAAVTGAQNTCMLWE